MLIGGLLVAGYIMDSVDGQLARLYGGGSKAGEWLDHTIDCTKTVSLHLAVAISWFRFPPVDSDYGLLIPLGFTVCASVSFFGLIIMPTLRPEAAKDTAVPQTEAWWRKFVLLPTDYGSMCLAFLLLGVAQLFLWVYTVFFVLNLCALLLALRKWWRELVALDQRGDMTRMGLVA